MRYADLRLAALLEVCPTCRARPGRECLGPSKWSKIDVHRERIDVIKRASRTLDDGRPRRLGRRSGLR